jgi:branched-chain amino acid transport system ATP-binding protein
VFDMVKRLNDDGRTVILVEQNARSGLQIADHGVVLESGRVRLEGTGRDILADPRIGELYLGKHRGREAVPSADQSTSR